MKYRLRDTVALLLCGALLTACGAGANTPQATPQSATSTNFTWAPRTLFVTVTDPGPDHVDDVLTTAVSSGISAVRIPLSWSDTEPNRGDFRWDRADAMVKRAHALGLAVMLAVGNVPRWAVADPSSGAVNAPPANADLFGEFVGAASKRYGGDISAWEIWYGANSPTEFGPSNPAAYCAMLTSAYQQIKNTNSHALVITAPTVLSSETNHAMQPGLFVRLLYTCAPASFDAIGVDPSSPAGDGNQRLSFQSSVDQLNVVVGIVSSMGSHGNRPIFYTPYAVPTRPAPGGVSYAAQAKELVDGVIFLRGLPYTGAVGIYRLQDGQGDTADDNSGLLTNDLTPKPAWQSLLQLPRN